MSLPSQLDSLSSADREVLRYVARHPRGPYSYSLNRKVDDLIDRGLVEFRAGRCLVSPLGEEAMGNA